MSLIRRRFSAARIVCLLAAGMVLTACSSGSSQDKREYGIPSSLCGTAVSSSALEPLLPPGKKLWPMKGGITGYARCQLLVDRKLAVDSIIQRSSPGTTLTKIAYGEHHLRPADVKKKKEQYIISDSAAVGHVRCSKKRKDGAEVFTVISKEQGSVGVAVMEKVITEFTDAASTSELCTEDDVAPSADSGR
ncbi:hypothetical protein [Streptomyces sp. JNUCC 63]